MVGRTILEFTQYIAPDGAIYHFETSDKFLMTETGLGMPPIDYITQRGPFQHGETVLDYRLRPRVVQLVHRRNTCSRDEYWEARADILNLLRPNRSAYGSISTGVLRKILADGTQRDLNVMIEQGPEFAPRSLEQWDEYGIYETLRFIAHDPIFYDPEVQSVAFTVAEQNELVFYNAITGASALSINFRRSYDPSVSDVPPPTDLGRGLVFAYGIINQSISITYVGTWLAYPTLVITGPLSGGTITNAATGEKLHFNYDVADGETVTVNLNYGEKSVTNQNGRNLIHTLTYDSDLSTFHLAPAPEVTGGVNTLNIFGANVLAGRTSITVQYNTRYIGI